MALLIIFYILILGYHYARSVPYENVQLRRSTGWGSYVLLGKHGLIFFIQGLILICVSIFLLSILCLVADWVILSIKDRKLYCDFSAIIKNFIENIESLSKILSFFEFGKINIIYLLVVLASPWYICITEVAYNDKEKHLSNLKSADSILCIIIEALQERETIKITLKSNKVYIGMVQSEQFERVDLDNITIIPFLSGHRQKDTLELEIDNKYIDTYINDGIVPKKDTALSEEEVKKLDKFRLSIRLSEIESVSFFDIKYYQKYFEIKKKGSFLKILSFFSKNN